jgi:hypothetical protein
VWYITIINIFFGEGMSISDTHNKHLPAVFQFSFLLIILFSILLLSGCQNNYTSKPNTWETQPFIWNDTLFVTDASEGGKERTVFRTNNERYWTLEGMTVWTVSEGVQEPFAGRTVTMGKPTGYSGGGYGIVFCQNGYETNVAAKPAMLVAMVNNEGQYILGKATGGIFTDYGWWKHTPYLNRGAGATNEITVTYEERSGDYLLKINGHDIEHFRDGEEPKLKGGKNGYIVVITPFDKFPASGIDVYFMEAR